MKGITAYVWAYNEEERLPITLNFLKGFDEIVIIDKSSTDKTADIGRQFGAKVHTLPYFESHADPVAKPMLIDIMNNFENDWAFEVTCSDVYHPDLCKCMHEIIQDDLYDAVEIPLYRYSMGYVSKYSFYGAITFQRKLHRKDAYDWNITALHADPTKNAKRVGRLQPSDPKVAIYHLTHENLEMVMERHLRYARVEAQADRTKGTREEYLERSWRSILRVVVNYIRKKTYKLGDDGKAQLSMLLMYRCANYLNLYFSKEKENEIHEVYEAFRRGEF